MLIARLLPGRPPGPLAADLNFLYLSSRLLEWVTPDLARTSLSGARLLVAGGGGGGACLPLLAALAVAVVCFGFWGSGCRPPCPHLPLSWGAGRA